MRQKGRNNFIKPIVFTPALLLFDLDVYKKENIVKFVKVSILCTITSPPEFQKLYEIRIEKIISSNTLNF